MNRISLTSKFVLFTLALMGSIVLLSLAPTVVFGQVSAGSIQGTVKDSTGAVVSGATVTVVNADTQFTRTDSTGASGLFSFNGLPLGSYKLTVQAKGFANYSENVLVTVGSRLDREISLSVGTMATTVEVLGTDIAVVNTINQEVSSVVSAAEVAQLPTLTRNPYDLVATAGNAQQDSQAGEGDGRGAGYALNGQRSASTSILLDGAENVDLFTAAVGQTVPQDSVQEFRVVSNGMTAEYGRASGGVVNVATKSGTNQFHGTAYEFNRVAALASNTYFNATNDTAKAGFTRNQFGYSIGGPIKKNKLFFFNNTEWIRVRSSAPVFSMVPDSAFIGAADTNTQNFFSTYGNLRSDLKTLGTVTVGDIYSSASCDPVDNPCPLLTALNAASPGMAAFNRVTYNTPSDAGGGAPQNTLMTVARVDFNISDRTQLFGRYSYYNETDFAGYINTSPYVGYETGQTNKDNNFLLSLTHSFTSNVLSSTRIVFTRLNGPVQPLGAAAVGPTLYMSNSYTGRVGGVHVGFPGYNEYTPGSAIPFGGPQNLIQLYQDLSWVHGKHTFRVGGQYIYTQDNRVFGAYEEAVESLGATTAESFDGFLGGTLNAFQAAVNPQGKFPCLHDPTTGFAIDTADCTVTLPVSAPSFSRSNLYNDLAFYGQDSWKVTPRFTLNLGLRWEYYGVQHNKNPNLDSNFYYGSGSNYFDQLRNGSVQIAPKSPVGSLWAPQKKNFGPRLGFAYDVFGDGKTSLRGGFGIAYERNFGNVTFNVIQNPPAYAVLSITPTDIGGPIAVTTDNAGPLGGSTGSKALGVVSLRHVSQNIKTAYTEQWNLGLERELRPNLVASLGYNGARGVHQYSISNINESGFAQAYLGDTSVPIPGVQPGNTRLNTQYSNINNRGSEGDSYYHAMVAQLRGTTKKVQYNANYTWSHSIDTLSSTFSDEVVNNGLGYLDPFNPGLDRGNSDYDARHRLSLSGVIPLPFYENSSNKLLQNTVGGWQFTPIFGYRTGYPFTVFDCSNSHSPYNCPRPDIPAGTSAPRTGHMSADTGGDWFNYLNVPAAVGEYTGPAFVTGTDVPFPFAASNIPTCTGLGHQGCSYPSNMQGRNYYTAPGNWNLIFGVSKGFTVTERVKLQFRAEFFDLTNHKNFYIVGFPNGGADVSSSTTVNAMKGGYGNPFDDHRNIQLALKLTF